MNFIRRTRLSLLFLLLLLLSVGIAQAQDNILHIVSNADIRTSDPHIAYESETWPTAALFYVGLVRWSDDNSEIVPALAESFTISDDGLVYTFVLREGLKFASGSDLTPEDVKWSFERLLNPATGSPTAYMFDAIEGTEAFQNGEADEVSGIRLLDDRTVEFTLTTPVWSLIQRFALAPGFILEQEGVEAAGENFVRQPAGAGPFMLDSWEPGVRISGSRNPNYYLPDHPFFDGFEMQLAVEPSVGILRIEAGEADVALDFVPNGEYPRLLADPVLSERLLPLAGFPNIDHVLFNQSIEPYNNPDVRKALAMATDRDRLVQLINGRAIAASGPIPPNVLGDNKELQPPAYDLEAARALLASAGYPEGFSGTFMTSTDPINTSMAQALISDWAQIGVNLELTTIDNAVYVDTLINQPDEIQVALINWWMDYPDPSNIWEPLLACDGSYNFGHYCDEDLEAAFVEANSFAPGDARWTAFSDFEAQIMDKMPDIFLYHRLDFYFTSERLDIKSDPAILLRWDKATVK